MAAISLGIALLEVGALAPAFAAILAGFLGAAIFGGLRLLSRKTRRKNGAALAAAAGAFTGLQEDDEVDFLGCCAPESVDFVLPRIGGPAVTAAASVVYTVLVGGAVAYLAPSEIERHFHGDGTAAVLIAFFGCLAVATALYSVVGAPPVDAAVFRLEHPSVRHFTRAGGCLALMLLHLAAAQHPREAGLVPRWTYGLFAALPLVWFMGVLPPPDALLAWATEQWLTVGLGGSAMASDTRLAAMVLVSTASMGVVYALRSSPAAAVGWAAGIGVALSCGVFERVLTAAQHRHRRARQVKPAHSGQTNDDGGGSHTTTESGGKMAFFLATDVAVAVGSAVAAAVLEGNRLDPPQALQVAVLCVWALQAGLREIQSVYVCFGLLRNPFYPKTQYGSKGRRRGVLETAGLVHQGLRLASPPLSAAFVATAFGGGAPRGAFVMAVAGSRALRWLAQSPERFLFEASVVSIVALAGGGPRWFEFEPLVIKLLLVAFLHDRADDFVDKLGFAAKMFYAAGKDKKHHVKHTTAMLVLSAVFFPVVLGVIALASLLSAPLLPLFGLPVFIIGYPRPKRFWPDPAGTRHNPSEDTVYYEHAAAATKNFFARAFAVRSMGAVYPGAHYLARFQNRFVWLHVVEVGYDYVRVSLKGLELQETSCHTAEATRVEDMFERAFEHGGTFSRNHNLDSVLLPTIGTTIEAYSDTRNSLAGVLDAPSTLADVNSLFVHTLAWVIGRSIADNAVPDGWLTMSVGRGVDRAAVTQNLTESWLKTVKAEGVDAATPLLQKTTPPKTPNFVGQPEDADAEPPADSPSAPPQTNAPSADSGRDTDSFDDLITGILDIKPESPPPESRPKPRANPSERDPVVSRTLEREVPRPSATSVSAKTDRTMLLRSLVPNCYLAALAERGHAGARASAAHVKELFSGRLPFATQDSKVLDGPLGELVLKAYRYAVKLAIDKAAMGDFDPVSEAELIEELRELDREWHVGPDGTSAWNAAVHRGTKGLFALEPDPDEPTAVRSHRLTLAKVHCSVGALSPAAVTGQWASLHLELVLFGNDDDERYSIQAHDGVLRNLTIQAADPPLGYPIYSEGDTLLLV